MQGLRVQSLVEELRSHILHEAAKTNKQQQQKKSVTLSPLGWEDLLKKGVAAHSSILPGKSHAQ